MDMERSVKRLTTLIGVSLVIIFVAKFLLSKAITQVGNAAAEKKQQATVTAAARMVPPSAAASAPEAQPVVAVPASGVPAESAVPASAAEGINGTR